MQISSSRMRSLTAAIVIGAVGISFTCGARAANVTYDGTAWFELTLVSVQDGSGGNIATDWVVQAEGAGEVDTFSQDFASAGGAVSTAPVFPDTPLSLGVGESFRQSSESSGSVWSGFAQTFALTDLTILLENNYTEDLTFAFNYEYLTDVAIAVFGGESVDAAVSATVIASDFFFDFDLYVEATADLLLGPPLSETFTDTGSFELTVAADDINEIAAYIETQGYAEAIPEPASIALLTAGLIGIGAVRRRKSA